MKRMAIVDGRVRYGVARPAPARGGRCYRGEPQCLLAVGHDGAHRAIASAAPAAPARELEYLDAARRVVASAQAREDAEEAAADYRTKLGENWRETGEQPSDEQERESDRLETERAEAILTVRQALDDRALDVGREAAPICQHLDWRLDFFHASGTLENPERMQPICVECGEPVQVGASEVGSR